MFRKNKQCLIVTISIATVLWSVVNALPYKKVVTNNEWLRKNDKVLISAHRGGSILNPENTEKAFDYVINETSFTDIVEIDIQQTKDNVIVIAHDESISRLIGEEKNYFIYDHTYEELVQYNLGTTFVNQDGETPYKDLTLEEAQNEKLTIMKFEDFLSKYNNARDFRMILEFKEKGKKGKDTIDKVFSLFEKEEYSWWKNRTMMMTFSTKLTNYIMKKSPSTYVSGLGLEAYFQQGLSLAYLSQLSNPKYQCLQAIGELHYKDYCLSHTTKKMIEDTHKRGQSIAFWTVNDEKIMKKLCTLKPDIITTDNPKLLYDIEYEN